jgi:hypothetical protein
MVKKIETPEARKRVIRWNIDVDSRRMTAAVGDAGELVIDVASLPAEVLDYAVYHGLKQYIGDGAAMPAGSAAADKLAVMQAKLANLQMGEWRTKGSGDGEGRKPAGVRFLAYQEFVERSYAETGKTPPTREAIRAKWDAMDGKQRAATAKHPPIAAIIVQMQATAKPWMDPDDLLNGF